PLSTEYRKPSSNSELVPEPLVLEHDSQQPQQPTRPNGGNYNGYAFANRGTSSNPENFHRMSTDNAGAGGRRSG
ncbi:hypothetical protein BGX26_011199, partial [Mortierella sp. AD094]